jgi:hypothetical protein
MMLETIGATRMYYVFVLEDEGNARIVVHGENLDM